MNLPRPYALLLASLLASCHAPEPVPARAVPVETQSVKPGINDQFLGPDVDLQRFVQRFEAESREIYEHRDKIAAALRLRQGMAVADVGAGTGFFSAMFARRVGASGKVYAVDLSPTFVEHLRGLRAREGLEQLEVVQCTERSCELPAESVDLVFVCDTYHHFEYPLTTMASIHRALRPGGELVLVDFSRIEGVSREWVFDHVRAGQEVFETEIASAGFEKVRDEDASFLTENYIVRFAKR